MATTQIQTDLKLNDDKTGFYLETLDQPASVEHGDQVYFSVTVSGIDHHHDPSGIGLLVALNGSNSKATPPVSGRGNAFWPFVEPPSRTADDPGNSKQYLFALCFEGWPKGGDTAQSATYTVRQDNSERQVNYQYTVWAAIPKHNLPKHVKPNSDSFVTDWPDIGMSGGDEYYVTSEDPEMWVDEC